MEKGRFIVVEGLEGAGKSTAMDTIRVFLNKKNIEHIVTREPGGTYVGEVARTLIKETRENEPLDVRAELLLFYAARVQLLEQVIRPAINRGCWVLADRFELSTFAYQGGGRKMDEKMIAHLSSFCVADLKPDLTIFLNIEPKQGLARVFKRGEPDRIEKESLDFFKRVYDNYHHHLNLMQNAKIIDASQTLPMVQTAIIDTLQRYINKHANSTID